ncbi:hypothetical protein, variant 1 [Aphanomyces astaci]|nr:hypothetical protein, variant 1 [Aphanomyces astaci]ETV79204.1 hypothetical protein, variant 1 [Aphanomyces astaci]|eukprot:XP_009831047.1 hypothetical protein, variant 1 [Aphanomyces astaci]
MHMDFIGGPPRAKQLTADEARTAALESKKQGEIDRGLREPNSGLLYGLYDPKNEAAPIENAMAAPAALPSVGDGGASWKRKMLQRAKQKAAATGESLESIVRAQYGMALSELEAQAALGRQGDDDSHLRYKRPRRPQQHQSHGATATANGKSGDKTVLADYASRMKFTTLSKETSGRHANEDQEDGGPIDYSKLPDDDDKRPHKRSRPDDRRRQSPHRPDTSRRSRSRSPDRRRRTQPPHRQVDTRIDSNKSTTKARAPTVVERTPAQQQDAARRAAFLYRQPPAITTTAMLEKSPPTSSTTTTVTTTAVVQAKPPSATANSSSTTTTTSSPRVSSDDPVDLNKLAAQALRAKMRGNLPLFHTLTKQLNELEHSQHQVAAAPSKKHQKPAKAPRAMVRPREPADLPPPHRPDDVDVAVGSHQGKAQSSDVNMSVDEMVRQEKAGSGDTHMDAVYARNIVRLGTRYEGSELSAGKTGAASSFDEDETPTALKLHQSSRLTEKAFVAASDHAARSDRMQWDKAMQNCRHCPQSDRFKGHLVVAMGPHAYVALPAASTVADLQCLIVPAEHVASLSGADEAVAADVHKFKVALVAMAASVDMSMVFLERTYDVSRKRHTFVECVPVPKDVGMDTPMFFKQAMLECDEEWSTHQKILDTTGKGINRTVPPNFAYFHVEWDSNSSGNQSFGGYAHIIEDAAQFPADFGLDTLAGMLDVDPPRLGRYIPNVAAENARVQSFQAQWAPYDWTTRAAAAIDSNI